MLCAVPLAGIGRESGKLLKFLASVETGVLALVAIWVFEEEEGPEELDEKLEVLLLLVELVIILPFYLIYLNILFSS